MKKNSMSVQQKTEIMKSGINQTKKGGSAKVAFIVAAVMALLVISPIDIIPDNFAAAYGAGLYDDIAYCLSFIVSMIVGFSRVKGGKKK